MFLFITHDIPSGSAGRSAGTTAVSRRATRGRRLLLNKGSRPARTGSSAFSTRPFRTTSVASWLLDTSHKPSQAIRASRPRPHLCGNQPVSSLGAPRFREPEIAGSTLQMHRFSSRASPLTTKRPRDHRACTNVVQFHFQDSSTRASSNTFSEAAPPQSRTHVSRLIAST